MTPKLKVSQRSDRFFGERDVSARATHLKAVIGKVSLTTIERKIMSTKTTIKRIALVAAASLGLGVLSVVPAQAAVTSLTVTVANGTAGLTGARTDSTNAATITITGLMEAGDSITATVVTNSRPSGQGAINAYVQNLDSGTPTMGNYVVDTRGAGIAPNVARASNTAAVTVLDTQISTQVFVISKSSAAANVSHTFGLQLDSSTGTTRIAGTYSYTVLVKAYHIGSTLNMTATGAQPDQTISKDVSITIAAASSASATAVSTYNFAQLSATSISAGATAGTDDILSVLATAGTVRGYLFVANRNAANGSATAKDSITATVTGAGLVCTAGSTICGKSIKVSATGDYQFELQGDGTGGNSSISITTLVSGSTFTKSLTYYAAAAKTLTASVLTPVLGIGSNDSAVAVTAVDGVGSTWAGTPYIYASSAADAAAVGGSSTTPVACVLNAAKTTAYCPISATAAGTGKFKVIDAATITGANATSNEVTVTSSNAIAASVKVTFDKATYAPYEKALVTVTPLDASGKPVASATFANLFAAGGLVSNIGFASGFGGNTATDLSAVSVTTSPYSGTDKTAGSYTYTVYMPATGTVTLTGKGGASLPAAGQVAVTATASVTSDGAAALAAVTALASQVSAFITKINAQITTLTDLVMKIQKKVKA